VGRRVQGCDGMNNNCDGVVDECLEKIVAPVVKSGAIACTKFFGHYCGCIKISKNSLVVEDDWVCNLIANLTINTSKCGKGTIIVKVTYPCTPYSFIERLFIFNLVDISRKWDASVPCPRH